jgi:hypothetical protein
MEPIKLDYGPLRAAITRADQAYVLAAARKLRNQHIANLLIRAATGARSVIMAIGHGVADWRKHRYDVAPER